MTNNEMMKRLREASKAREAQEAANAELRSILTYAGADDATDVIDELKSLRNDAINHETLLKLFRERTEELERLRTVVDAISEATLETITDADLVEHILRDHPDSVPEHYQFLAKALDKVSSILSQYTLDRLERKEAP